MKLYPYAKLHGNLIEDGVGEFMLGRPKGITVHYTAGGTATSSIDYLRKTALRYHLLIDRSGAVYQLVYLDRKVNHAGVSSWLGHSPNSNHIAIAVANWGKLDDQHFTWTRKSLPSDQVVCRPYNNRDAKAYWEACSEDQEESLLTALKFLCKHDGINPENICGHDESTARKIDPGGCLSLTMKEIRDTVCRDF